MTIKAIETRYRGYRFRSKAVPIPPRKRMSARADRAGRRMGRLTVRECLGLAGAGHRWWGCECDCGERVAVRSRELDRGHTQSCGCLQREIAATQGGRNKLPPGHASRNELLASYKKSAHERGIDWDLDDEQFFATVALDCAYCGSQPDLERKPNAGVNGGFVYSGIDRIDNAAGYVSVNVVPCCWNCNRAKGTLTLKAFMTWLDRTAAFAAARSARFEHGESPR